VDTHLVVVDEAETRIFIGLGRCRSRRRLTMRASALLLWLPGSPTIWSMAPRLREEAADDGTGLLGVGFRV